MMVRTFLNKMMIMTSEVAYVDIYVPAENAKGFHLAVTLKPVQVRNVMNIDNPVLFEHVKHFRVCSAKGFEIYTIKAPDGCTPGKTI